MDRIAALTKNQLAAVVTVAALVGFAAFVVYLLVDISADETAWSRRAYLFAAVEAITFAGVGWLFGKEVHRERAEKAEKRANTAATKAENASADAVRYRERGVSLRRAIHAAQQGHQELAPHLRRTLGAAAETAVASTRTQLDQLAAQADELFPDS